MWGVKAKAVYGQVQQKVDTVKSMPQHQKANLANVEANNQAQTNGSSGGGAVVLHKQPTVVPGGSL